MFDTNDLDIPFGLINAISEKKLIVFCGAGCSMYAGAPSWTDLTKLILYKIIPFDQKISTLVPALESGVLSPLSVLDTVSMHKKHVYEAIQAIIDVDLDQKNLSIQDKILGISEKVITTNFDKFLEKACKDKRKVVSPVSDFNMSTLRDLDSFIFKAHGDISVPDKCAIFSRDYDYLYRADGIFNDVMKGFVSRYSFLFVGFSLSDPYFDRLFNFVSNVYGDYARDSYVISTSSMGKRNIEEIIIPDHSYLSIVLDKISKMSHGKSSGSVERTRNGKASLSGDREIVLDGVDVPPDIPIFVGRDEEIRSLSQKSCKVYCISGIGGQGKSALASRFMAKSKDSYKDTFWRDFKEEDHMFSSKILTIIRAISSLEVADSLYGASEETLIVEFFNCIGSDEYLFVLDNVDSYVSTNDPDFMGPIGRLVSEAERRPHKSTFILTCRPFIFHASANFHQIKLKDLSIDEVSTMFRDSGINISESEVNDAIRKTFSITNGHPLWTTLVLHQASRGKEAFRAFLDDISIKKAAVDGDFSLMADDCLGSIWSTLNANQRELLRIISESPGTESVKDLESIVSGEMNFQKFSKSLRVLRSFGLVIDKSDGRYVELHPLVKKFIRDKYPDPSQRSKYISLFVDYLGRIILVLRPKIKSGLSHSECENWTNKIRLNLQRGKQHDAFNDLCEIFYVMQSSGYTEELVKTIIDFLSSISWAPRFEDRMKGFDGQFHDFLAVLAEYGETDQAFLFCEKFRNYVGDSGERFLRVLGIETYLYWVTGDFSRAVEMGEKGEYYLKLRSATDTYSIEYNLALARRDLGGESNIKKALDFFLKGEKISDVLDVSSIKVELAPQFYGNVGRCLQLLGRLDDAYICYAKSYRMLTSAEAHNRIINIGYASSWIYEVLVGQDQKALFFLSKAVRSWKETSPPLLNRLRDRFRVDIGSERYKAISGLDDWRVDKECGSWIDDVLKDV